MAQAVVRSLDLLATTLLGRHLVLVVDGAYEYSEADIAAWDRDGPGSTFKKYYAPYVDLALHYGFKLEEKPTLYDISETRM